jgi:hypothetical protein
MTTLTDIFKDFLCGWTSGITQVFVMQPFEIVKVRLINQSFKDSYYKGTIDCFRKIRIEEGLLAFYRGTNSCKFRNINSPIRCWCTGFLAICFQWFDKTIFT